MASISILDDNYSNLIQHFDLSETINENNILLDKSYNSNNSLIVSSPPTIEYDEQLKRNVSVFNGTSNYIPIGKTSKVTDVITINALAYTDDWSKPLGRIISCTQSGGWNFFNDYKRSFYISINSNYTIYECPLEKLLSGWNMITMSFDGYSVKYYINGILINTIEVSNIKSKITYDSTNGIFIGVESYSGSETSIETNPVFDNGAFFKGKIADIRIYNEALSNSNIKILYNYLMYKEYNYIKQDNKYYGFSDDNYDTTTKMYKEVTLDNIKNLEYSNSTSNLTKEITIGDETFKPIDKFTNFQLISFYNNPKTVIGSKSKSGLIVANGDIYAGKISNRINSFTLDYTVNNNSAIKMAVSFDNGSTWKTYKDGAFQELSITIPNKYYTNMTDEEKTNYSNAKTTILESGFNASDLSSIDFNIDNLDTIRFAYVLYQDSINDDCKMSDLSWNFNAKGYLQKMKDSEVDTSFCNGIIKITPLIDCEMIITNYNY